MELKLNSLFTNEAAEADTIRTDYKLEDHHISVKDLKHYTDSLPTFN